jgi:hypothetical protein
MYRCVGKGGAVSYQDYSCDKATKTTAAAEFTPEPVPSSTVQGERKKAGWIYCVLLSCDHLASQRSVRHSLAWNAGGGARRVRVPGTRESAFSIPCWPRANRRCRHAPAAPRSVDRRSHACKAGRRSYGAPGADRPAGRTVHVRSLQTSGSEPCEAHTTTSHNAYYVNTRYED